MSKDEKEFVESIRLQLSLLDTLGNNFIDIALINVEDERVTLIKTQSKQNSVQLDAKYSSICKESIQKYVNKNKQQALIQKLSLNQIRFELSKSKEYSVNFCGSGHEQNRYYQVKYIYLFDLEHILMIFKRLDNQYSDVENLRKERAFLDVLCRDYTSVYYYNSQDDALEVLKMGENSNEVHLIGKEIRVVYKYTDEMK